MIDAKEFLGGPGHTLTPTILKRLGTSDTCQLGRWLLDRIQVFSSGHASALLQIDPRPEVTLMLNLCLLCLPVMRPQNMLLPLAMRLLLLQLCCVCTCHACHVMIECFRWASRYVGQKRGQATEHGPLCASRQ